MNILVTGSNGFVGKNLISELNNIKDGKTQKYNIGTDIEILPYDININQDKLDEFCQKADFVFHLAGVNRPKDEKEFMEGNFGFTSTLLDTLKKYNNKAPILITSSIQAALDNPYGKSKKAGEDLIFNYGKENNVNVFVYRLPNLFGKWCKPNYNSVIATFCHNIANDMPITVNDESVVLTLSYIDDVVSEFINAMVENLPHAGFSSISKTYEITLGKLAKLIKSFKGNVNFVPDVSDEFTKKLYSTYLSYLPKDSFSMPLKMNIDNRGSFTEMLKTPSFGQISVNISRPHITKGNHWHHTKVEKFIVVSGKGVIRFRNIFSDEVIEYFVSGEKIEVVDIPAGYTHNIENLGDTDMVTIMWCNESFDPDNPDTYYLEV